jgi:hypothetical protein
MAGMDNYYRPPGGGPQDHQPTEQFWSGQNGPAAQHDPGPAPGYGIHWQQQPGLQAHLAKDRRKALHWTVGVTLAALLAGGGTLAGISLASTPLSVTPAASTGTGGTGTGGTGTSGTGTGGTGTSTGSQGQAALLDAALTTAGSPDAALTTAAGSATAVTGTPAAPGAPGGSAVAGPAARPCLRAAQVARAARQAGRPRLARGARAVTARCRHVRRRIRFFLLRGVDGQFTFRSRAGALKTLAYERGVIETLTAGSSIVVKAADGTTWTWDLTSSTVVRDGSGKVGQSALASGEPVWVGGPVVNGAKDARLIFVRPPSGTS